MNAARAKRIKRGIYGDMAIKPRHYQRVQVGNFCTLKGKTGALFTIRNKPGSLRALYQAAKRKAKNSKREN